MERKKFIKNTLLGLALPFVYPSWLHDSKPANSHRLLRHATLLLEMDGRKILVDPMLSVKDALDPVANAANAKRIPMTGLPIDAGELAAIIASLDAVVVTHTHRDHWDESARQLIPKSMHIICQPADAGTIIGQGYTNVTPVQDSLLMGSLRITRTDGHHGTGETELKMGTVSGFVMDDGAESLYIAGDTIWCNEVQQAIAIHRPDIIVLNAGEARFLTGGPITMDASDVITVARAALKAKIVAVHMETVNHCILERSALRQKADEELLGNVFIPKDGEYF